MNESNVPESPQWMSKSVPLMPQMMYPEPPAHCGPTHRRPARLSYLRTKLI